MFKRLHDRTPNVSQDVGLRKYIVAQVRAELYASASAYDAVREAMRDVSMVSEAALSMSETKASPVQPARLYEICGKMLFHAASRLATDVREHLGLSEIPREWRLYDKEFRELQQELSEWERRDETGDDPDQDG